MEIDRRISAARKGLDWETQEKLGIDPGRAHSVHAEHMSKSDTCSMCGEMCAVKLVSDFLGENTDKC
jgi:phosphomethylpyrimidine synthase